MQIGKPKGTKTTVTSNDVFCAIVDLYQSNPPREATRKTISHELGVSYHLVDEHVDRLLERGKIRRVLAGVFAPMEVQRDKVVSSTHVPGGRIKLDVDDVCIDLSPRDARAIVQVLAGFALVPLDLQTLRAKAE